MSTRAKQPRTVAIYERIEFGSHAITSSQLASYADWNLDDRTDFASYRDAAILAREVVRLRLLLARAPRAATKKARKR